VTKVRAIRLPHRPVIATWEYYALHGRSVHVPNDLKRQPERQALTWHNENRYLG
jgi:hypothetical protein